MMIKSAPVWLLILLSWTMAVAQDFSQVEISVTPLGGDVYMLVGAGGNIGFHVGPDDIFLIDCQYEPLQDKITEAIAQHATGGIAYLLNTHLHMDHTSGNAGFSESGAVIIAHRNVRERLVKGQKIEFLGAEMQPYAEKALPGITFSDSLVFHRGAETLTMFHLRPAHTDGDVIVHFERANVIQVGDLFFNGLFPFIDISSGGDVNGLIESVRVLIDQCDSETKIIPGHGPLASRTDLETYLEMLVDVRDGIAKGIAAGRTLEEIKETGPANAWQEPWGKDWLSAEQFTEMVYGLLTR